MFERYFSYYLAYVYITSVTIAVTSLLVAAFQGNLDSFTNFLLKVAQAVPKASGCEFGGGCGSALGWSGRVR